ncbi:MAG: mannose-1-phosphate guanylyltransferase [Gemmatimonadetes bacterium]|nr:mannose-1-phosphate guanylyltransferase [Gemmatimonadota bacterium]
MSRWAAVLAGGAGTRFWPLSTGDVPKQMLPLVGRAPLLVQTVARLEGLIAPGQVLIVTGERLAARTRQLLPGLPVDNLLIEPRAASTGPALAWATAVAAGRDPSASVLAMHADWFVGDDDAFRASGAQALEVAERHDVLVTVGVVPTRVEVGYGYIIPGDPMNGGARRVARFVEKPDAGRAAGLIQAGALWNSGLFAWTAARFFAETDAVATEIAPHVAALRRGDVAGFFREVTPIAVDLSYFERSRRVAVVSGRFPWDDVGTWGALARVRPRDRDGNVVVGEVATREATGCVLWSEEGPVVVDGVQGLVVVRAHGITLVTTVERAQFLKTLLESLPAHVREPG